MVLSASGSHRVWLQREIDALTSPDERASWLASLVTDLVPVVAGHEGAEVTASDAALAVRARLPLEPGPDGTLRLEPLTYAETLLRRHGGPATRRFPILVEADLHVEVSAHFHDWRAGAMPAVDETNEFFSCRSALRHDERGVTWTASFDVRPRVVEGDVYPGFRQSLQRVARPAPIVLSR